MPHDDNAARKLEAPGEAPGPAEPHHDASADPPTASLRDTPPGTADDAQTVHYDDQILNLHKGDPDQWRQAMNWLSQRHKDTDQPRRCYYILQSSFDPEHGYIPVAITENEAGYRPMTGQGTAAAPWYWGRDLATARRICDDANTGLGHTASDVREIVLSSLAAHRS